MCFGVASSPESFQLCIDAMIAGLRSVAFFIDGVFVTGADKSDHLRNIELLFERLSEYASSVTFAKYEFFRSSIEYIGHIIDKNIKRPSSKLIICVNLKILPATGIPGQKQFLSRVLDADWKYIGA